MLLAGCSERLVIPPEKFAHHEPDARYEELVPYYVELCAVSQYRFEALVGGSPGHATMYLKGACRDREAPYPRLRRCAEGVTDPADPEHGAGISVKRWFRTTNRIAVDRRARSHSDLAPDEVATMERLRRAAREAVDEGVFRGVELWPWPEQTPDSDMVDFATLRSAGTDFALLYARAALCGRLPITSEMLDEVVHFLNDRNRDYVTGVADSLWSGYLDICVHTLRNALAAASVWEPVSVRRTRLLQTFHLAIPANEALNPAARGTLGPIESYPAIFGNDAMRDAMLDLGWLPTRHGVQLVSLPVHPHNEVFDTRPRILALQGPIRRYQTRRLVKLLDDPRFTDLDANLRHFEDRYRHILARREEQDLLATVRGDRYRRVRRRYFAVTEQALADVRAMQGAPIAAGPPRGPGGP